MIAQLTCRMASSPEGFLACGIGHFPPIRSQVQADYLRAVNLLLRMVRSPGISAPSEHEHFVVHDGGGMKVPVGRRIATSVHEGPMHRLQIQIVHIAGEFVNHFLEAPEDVHSIAVEARRVAVSRPWNLPGGQRFTPLQGLRVEAEQNITNYFVIASSPDVDFVLVCYGRVAISLEWDVRVLAHDSVLVLHSRSQGPPHVVRVQDVDIDGAGRSVILPSAIATERVDVVSHCHRGMVHSPRTAVQIGNPAHTFLLR